MKAAKLEIRVGRQEAGGRRKEEEARSQKKCFYQYEMLPIHKRLRISIEVKLQHIAGK
ncbi:hypothetical protein [Microcoleus sp. MON2_D5]|uniref:hypothetical protein n=1 Tax=Microcoleus sp. MON2_D5 TaxID=2818833 RepID=UPI002FD2881B